MLRYTSGDLLDSDAEALVNTVNTVGVMGKGLALQFKHLTLCLATKFVIDPG